MSLIAGQRAWKRHQECDPMKIGLLRNLQKNHSQIIFAVLTDKVLFCYKKCKWALISSAQTSITCLYFAKQRRLSQVNKTDESATFHHSTSSETLGPWLGSGGEGNCLGKNVRGLEWPRLGSGLAIVPQEKVIRKWNLDQLTAVFVQGRVGWEKCFWKLFSPPFTFLTETNADPASRNMLWEIILVP